MNESKILIIDDEKDILNLLAKTLEFEGYKVLKAEKASIAIKIIEENVINVVLSDIKLPDANGIELTGKIKKVSPETEVICLTAFGNIHDGVQAMKNGAFDYLIKGDDNAKIIPLVSKADEKSKLQFRVKELETKLNYQLSFEKIIGKSIPLQEAIKLAKKVAPSDATVLLTGPTGTGKEVFAKAIHSNSRRMNKPFIAVNCSAFGKDLLESELFGYKKGAFTGAEKDKKGLFEEANNGTIFLDEIGELNLDLQAKLLRVLESGSFLKLGDTKESFVDVRIIAATNRILENEFREGKFREDLFFRLSVFQIKLPALSERQEDISPIAEHFVAYYSIKSGKKITNLSKDFLQALRKHTWRGNIRELRNVIERAVILCENQTLTSDLLPTDFTNEKPNNSSSIFNLKDLEKHHIKIVLERSYGNKTKAAKLLGIGLTTLYRKMEEYQISNEK